MAPTKWRFAGTVDADPDDVYAWLADHREDDHTSEAFFRGSGFTRKEAKGARREILSRDGDNLRLRDTWGRNTFESTVTLDPDRREVRIDGEHGYEGVWRAEDAGEGRTRVVSEGRMAPGNFLFKLFMPLFRGKFLRQIEQDFHGHIEEVRVEVAGEGA